MSGGDDNAWMMELFREEAGTQLAALQDGLMALETTDNRRTVLEDIMRAAHSMKGAARIAGLTPLVKLTHAIEDIFVAAIAGTCEIDADGIDVLLAMVDFLNDVTAEPERLPAREPELPGMLERLDALRHGRKTLPPAAAAAPSPEAAAPAAPTPPPQAPPDAAPAPVREIADLSLLELFREEADGQLAALTDGLMALESSSEPRVVLETLMRAAHSLKGAARIIGLDHLVKLTHATEDLFVAALAGSVNIGSGAIDTLLDIIDHITDVASGDPVRSAARTDALPATLERLAELRAGRVPVPAVAVEPPRVVEGQAAESGVDPPVSQAPAAETPVMTAPAAASARDQSAAAPKPAAASKAIRMTAEALERITGLAAESVVEAERLELLMDDAKKIGRIHRDLQTALAGLREELRATPGGQNAGEAARKWLAEATTVFEALQARQASIDEALEDYARRTATIARRLSRESLASRMLPFSSILRGYPRLVRDISRDLGKRCRLEVRGEKTHIDREILEQLDAPLNHIVRNALDHGMEMPDARVAQGKPAEGRLEIEAFHRAGRLQVVIRDDGRGIDAERLRQKVVERGLESAANAERLSVAELYEFLFLPGFSTAATVTELSGRGVGLDAVRTMVQEAGGSVSVNSTLGSGTTFNLELPVTRSVTRALVSRVGGERYALPIAGIERALAVERSAFATIEGRPYFLHEGNHIALVPAAEILELPTTTRFSEMSYVVLLRDGERRYGLVVDGFDGERSFVVRQLDARLGDVTDVAAVSIDEQGGVVLILDVAELVRSMDALITGGRLLRVDRLDDASRTKRKRVLVVDDSLTVRQAERQMLENQGYAVDVAIDGMEGWSAVRIGAYDLVVSDVDMPRMNGIELVKRIRADARLRELPVVIVSYKDREEDRLRGLEAGASHYLAKGGFQDASLINVVRDLIGAAQDP
jgi:two-component system sensor histidine kinase and response regulator WspE